MGELEDLKNQLEEIRRIWNVAQEHDEVDYFGNATWIDELDKAINK